MKQPLILSLLLLGTVSAFHLETAHPHLETPKGQEDLWQDADASREQGGELAVTQETLLTKGEAVKCSEDEEAVESNPNALDENATCPREEDAVYFQGTPGCKSCRYVLVRTPKTFCKAQRVCRRCYRGNLVSIHSYNFNSQVHCLARKINQSYVWIGGILRGCFWKKFRWTDRSRWDFGFWAPGQPGNGGGRCVTLCTKGGHWRRASCKSRLPFVCSF
ncbi:proteoglycan 3 [Acomys russatus]|uniref:proteoglycan 3 n=1 Tax=Acomys russatus TaxID=60746 RepID=UPI0021E24983|nr:proteoglycan 3 [Acomys russatus]